MKPLIDNERILNSSCSKKHKKSKKKKEKKKHKKEHKSRKHKKHKRSRSSSSSSSSSEDEWVEQPKAQADDNRAPKSSMLFPAHEQNTVNTTFKLFHSQAFLHKKLTPLTDKVKICWFHKQHSLYQELKPSLRKSK